MERCTRRLRYRSDHGTSFAQFRSALRSLDLFPPAWRPMPFCDLGITPMFLFHHNAVQRVSRHSRAACAPLVRMPPFNGVRGRLTAEALEVHRAGGLIRRGAIRGQVLTKPTTRSRSQGRDYSELYEAISLTVARHCRGSSLSDSHPRLGDYLRRSR